MLALRSAGCDANEARSLVAQTIRNKKGLADAKRAIKKLM